MGILNVNLMAAAHTARGAAGIGLRGTLAMEGENYVLDNQNVGTSVEPVAIGDVEGASALVYLENMDGTNSVQISADDACGSQVALLLPGQFCVFFSSPAAPALWAKANTAGIILAKRIFEDVSPAALGVYRPVLPSDGLFAASFALTGTVDGHPVSIRKSLTENVARVGMVNRTVPEEGTQNAWPTDFGLVGGTANKFGWICGFNPDAEEISMMHDLDAIPSGDMQEFAVLPAGLGFYLLPVNRAYTPWQFATTPHEAPILATRLDTPPS